MLKTILEMDLDPEQKKKVIAELTYEDQCYLVDHDQWLDELINTNKQAILLYIANSGKKLDRLCKSRYEIVRAATANHYGPHIFNHLVFDKSELVRAKVASNRWCLDVLCDDESEVVRGEVARVGFDTPKYVKDESDYVCIKAMSIISDVRK